MSKMLSTLEMSTPRALTQNFERIVLDYIDMLHNYINEAHELLARNQWPDIDRRFKIIQSLSSYFRRLGNEVYVEFLKFRCDGSLDSFKELFGKYSKQLKKLVDYIIEIAENPNFPEFLGCNPWLACATEKINELDELVCIASECFAKNEHYVDLRKHYEEIKLDFWRRHYNDPDENFSEWFGKVYIVLKQCVDNMFSIDKSSQESITDRAKALKEKYETNFERIHKEFTGITVPKELEKDVPYIKNLYQSSRSTYKLLIEEQITHATTYKSINLVEKIIDEAIDVLSKYISELQCKTKATNEMPIGIENEIKSTSKETDAKATKIEPIASN